MAGLLKGYSKLPGKARRYKTPSGGTISRRQYENIVFQQAGWESWADYQKTAKTDEYKRFLESASAYERGKQPYWKMRKRVSYSYYKNTGRTGINPGMRAADSDFNRAYLAARKAGFAHDANGPFADFLTKIGLRAPTANFDVGDTP